MSVAKIVEVREYINEYINESNVVSLVLDYVCDYKIGHELKELFQIHNDSATYISLNGNLYGIGGHNRRYISINAAKLYDPTTNTWTSVASMQTKRECLAAVALGGKIYAIGWGLLQPPPQQHR